METYELFKQKKVRSKKRNGNTIASNSMSYFKIKYDDEIIKYKAYPNIDIKDIYTAIYNKNTIDINSCIISDLSLYDYRKIYKLKPDQRVDIEKFNASGAIFSYLNLTYAHFKSTVYFNKTIFNDKSFFTYSKFDDRAYFTEAQFEELFFSNVIIENEAFFRKTSFRKTATFQNVIFNDSVDYRNTIFNKKVLFQNSLFNKTVDFSIAKLVDVADFSYAIFNSKFICDLAVENISLNPIYINFKRAVFSESVDFTANNFSELNLYGCIFEKYAIFKDCKIEKASRETYRIIKHEFLKSNNRIDAVKYSKLEISEIWKEQGTTKLEKALLYLYSYVNDYGTDIGRAIRVFCCFTLILFLGFTFFGYEECYFSEAFTNHETIYQAVKKSVHNYTLLLLPTHKLSDLYGKISVVGIVLDYFFRIYIPIMFFFILQPLKKYKSW